MAQPGAAGLTLGNIAKAYKDIFSDRKVEQLGFKKTDLWRWMPKKMDFYGGPKSGSGGFYDTVVKYAGPQARLSKFAAAQQLSGDLASVSKVARFSSLRRVYYGYVTLDEESVIAASKDVGSFFRTGQEEIRDLIDGVMQDVERYLWGDGTGVLAQVGTAPSGVTFALKNPEDTINFEIGMRVSFSTNSDGTGVLGADATNTTVAGINPDAGTITTSDDVTDDAAPIIADTYIFKGGDTTSADPTTGDAGGVVFEGLNSWVPLTAETSGTFLGQDRTQAVVELQGFRQSYLGSIEETIKKLHSKMSRRGRRPDTIWLSFDNWHEFELELGSRAVRNDGAPATFGLPSIRYSSPSGIINIMTGAFCPDDRGYLLTRKSWMFHHMEGAPHVVTADGRRTRVMPDLDAMELRVRLWGNLICHNPFDNGVFNIT